AIFKPLGMELASRLEKQLGSGMTVQGFTPPSPPPPSHELVESKMMQCEHCDAGVALLIFADQATDHGGLEDYARKMYPQVQQANLPTWVIGPPSGEEPLPERPADILKIWPEHEPVQRLRPAEFNPVVDQLARTHCGDVVQDSPDTHAKGGDNPVADEPTPNWQPISFLPNVAEMIDGMLESAEDVYGSLQQAQHQPHVMDDYTIGSVREVHTTQRNDLWLYEEQLAQWQHATPTPEERTEITRLQRQLDQLKSVLTACLTLADELGEGTMEKVLGKSDVELAIDVLTGKRKL
ncbi:MAG: hypothetical protein V3U27_06715, partial [Candidatus Tectomicrobia bacterium]